MNAWFGCVHKIVMPTNTKNLVNSFVSRIGRKCCLQPSDQNKRQCDSNNVFCNLENLLESSSSTGIIEIPNVHKRYHQMHTQ